MGIRFFLGLWLSATTIVGCSGRFGLVPSKKADQQPEGTGTSQIPPPKVTTQNTGDFISAPMSSETAQLLDRGYDEILAIVRDMSLSGATKESHSPTHYDSDEEASLEKNFFNAFLSYQHASIEPLKERFKEYLKRHPKSAYALGRLAFLNLWQWQERYYFNPVPGDLPRTVSECFKYFRESFEVAPLNMAFRGFGGNCMMLTASLSQNDALMIEANKIALQAIRGLPEYSLFSLSYTFIQAPAESKRFKVGSEMVFRLLDICYGRYVDRENPDIRSFIGESAKIDTPYHYYCRNTFMTPHTMEGWLLTLGDVLVKAGRLKAAAVMYENVRASPGFAKWPFKFMVDDRLANLEKYSREFNLPIDMLSAPDHATMAATGQYSCSLCHMASSDEKNYIMERYDAVVAAKKTISGALMVYPTP
jgi:hypothetical protein